MKAISINQPFASFIVDGIGDIINASWHTKFRGRVLVHTGVDNVFKNALYKDIVECLPDEQREDAIRKINGNKDLILSRLPTSAIIGSVEIVDCGLNHTSVWAGTTSLGAMSIGIKPKYNWVVANPIKFPEPIPAKGKGGMWNYTNILAEPEEENGKLYCHCQLPVAEKHQVSVWPNNQFRCRYCGGIWYK